MIGIMVVPKFDFLCRFCVVIIRYCGGVDPGSQILWPLTHLWYRAHPNNPLVGTERTMWATSCSLAHTQPPWTEIVGNIFAPPLLLISQVLVQSCSMLNIKRLYHYSKSYFWATSVLVLHELVLPFKFSKLKIQKSEMMIFHIFKFAHSPLILKFTENVLCKC